jgi:hypothetical protein
LSYSWEPPECAEQNGPISQYEYKITGLDEWNQGSREGISPRTKTDVGELMPGSLYRFEVRAYTSEGAGPWSEPVDARTTGSEVGAPRDLSAIKTQPTAIQLTWLPPHPEGPTIVAYKVQHSPRGDTSKPVDTILSGDELACSGFDSPVLTGESVCTEVKGLKPKTNYRFKVQAQAPSGNWGPWSPEIYATTKSEDVGPTDLDWLGPPTDLRLLDKSDTMLYVDWMHPDVFEVKIKPKITLMSFSQNTETCLLIIE